MHINLERRLIYGGDTSSTISPLVADDFIGFEGEFPLLVFSEPEDPGEIPREIVLGKVIFHVTPVEGSFGDLWLITAKPNQPESNRGPSQRSTVVYSIADGVLLLGFSASIGEKIYPINLVPCGNETLKFDDLRRFADSAGP